MFLSPSAARMMFRPMRPNPLMPTLTAIDVAPQVRPRSYRPNAQFYEPSDATATPRCYSVRPYSLLTLVRRSSSSRRTSCIRRFATRSTSAACGQRLGYLPITFNVDGEESIWIHAVSVGEALTARALAERSQGALSAAAAVPVDDDDRRAAGGAAQPPARRRGVLFSVRLGVHRPPHAEHRESRASS